MQKLCVIAAAAFPINGNVDRDIDWLAFPRIQSRPATLDEVPDATQTWHCRHCRFIFPNVACLFATRNPPIPNVNPTNLHQTILDLPRDILHHRLSIAGVSGCEMLLGIPASRPALRLLRPSIPRCDAFLLASQCSRCTSSATRLQIKPHNRPRIQTSSFSTSIRLAQERQETTASTDSEPNEKEKQSSDSSQEKSPFQYSNVIEPYYDTSQYHALPQTFGANQYMYIDEGLRQSLRQLLWQFKAPIRYAFAYGSGVFSQGTSSAEKPMIDLIFGVTYTQHWHSLNLTEHPDHYSFLGKMGSGTVARVQDRFGAGVYFNTYVEINGMVRG